MAHHFPVEGGRNGDEREAASDSQQRPRGLDNSHLAHGLPLGSMPMHHPQRNNQQNTAPTLRSSPIAIVRNPEDKKCHPDDSSDDEEEQNQGNTIDVEMDTLNLAGSSSRTSSRSLPNHLLLRAPRLGSVPTRTNDWGLMDRYPSMLPPAAQSSEHPLGTTSSRSGVRMTVGGDDKTSYGSLRDSHQRGRFLDGPSSYRDKRTGNVRRFEHRVRFQDNNNNNNKDTTNAMDEPALAFSMPASLSIGERIMKNSRQKQQAEKQQLGDSRKEPASSLAALLEASPAQTPESGSEPEPLPDMPVSFASSMTRTPTFYDVDNESRLPNNMLSSSLTGLEVLQRGLRLGDRFQAPAASFTTNHPTIMSVFGDMEELPRDAAGNNALLSRSHSDPAPHIRHRLAVAPAAAATTTTSPVLNSRGHVQTPTARRTVPFLFDPTRLIPPQHANNNNNSNSSNNFAAGAFPPPLNLDGSVVAASLSSLAPTAAYPQLHAQNNDDDDDTHGHHHRILHDHTNPPSSELHPSSDHDPDTDFAFDLEME